MGTGKMGTPGPIFMVVPQNFMANIERLVFMAVFCCPFIKFVSAGMLLCVYSERSEAIGNFMIDV